MDAVPVNHRREVTGVVFLSFAIILGVSYYLPDSATGWLGVFLRSLGKGLFGVCAYAIPVLFMYAAIDFLLEKRFNVAPRRVMSVLLVLLAAAAIFPVFTVDKGTIQTLCLDATKNKALAGDAFVLLWKSGINPEIVRTGAADTSTILTGGVIGGSIALGLEYLAARTGALIILFAFVISQIGLIFNVSLSRTATRTAEAIRSTTQKATGAIRSGAESLRAYSRQNDMQNDTPADSNGYPGSQTDISYLPQKKLSPFAEPDINRHSGFIDLEGTDAPMTASSYRGRNPYDVDLSNPGAVGRAAAEKQCTYEDALVETDFLRPAHDPIPTSDAKAISEMPGFLTDREEPTWLDIQTNAINPAEETLAHIPIRRIGTDGNVVAASGQDDFDERYDADFCENDSSFPRAAAGGNRTADTVLPASNAAVVTAQSASTTVSAAAPSSAAVSSVPAGANPPESAVKIPPEKSKERQISIAFPKQPYKAAPLALLQPDSRDESGRSTQSALIAQGKKLEDTLASFGVAAKVINITHGPAITRFELSPGPGIKVSRIVNLTDDIALAMASVGVRIEAPIPGKSAIGIEIPNTETSAVTLRSLLESTGFKKNPSPLLAALGRDIPGNPIFCDLAKMPHLLIAGATGSGKSVCINAILISILCKATPDQVKLIMIDPKVVELSIYNGIPHLLAPVVTDPKKAANTLNWAVGEMTRRYGLFAETSVRDFRGYNEEQAKKKEASLPLILIVIDELADLMQVASKEVEDTIARLTAMARAAGIHLLIATQRPSVDVITGVIKANIPSRIAFAVASQVDSRTILDMVGAEKLLGKGDMLYYPQSAAKPQRGQGAFVSDAEVESVIEYLKAQNLGSYDPEEAEAITSATSGTVGSSAKESGDEDELLPQAVEIILMAGCASVSILQRRMNIGYPRAARLIDRMHEKGYIGPFEGSKPRKLLISQSQWLEIQSKGG